MLSILLPLSIVLMILAYFQLFYQSKRLESGLAKTVQVFHGHKAQVRSVKFSADGSRIISGGVDKKVFIRDRPTGAVIHELLHPEGITYLDVAPDGRIVTSSYDGVIRIWDDSSGKMLKEFSAGPSVAWTVAFSPDGQQVASSGEDTKIHLWNAETGTLIRSLKGHQRNVWSVRFSPDGRHILSGSFDESINLWNLQEGRLEKTIAAHSSAVVDVNISRDGKLFASTSDDKTIRTWSFPDALPLHLIRVPEHIQAAAFSPDGKWLLVAGRDKPMIGEFLQEVFGDSKYNPGVSMRLYDAVSGKLVQTFRDHFNDVNDVAWSPAGHYFASASEDHSVRVYLLKQ